MKKIENNYRRKIGKLSILHGNTYIKNSAGDLDEKGLEKLFFDYLNKMGLDGKVNLQRVENDGNVKIITLDSNNQPTPITC